MFDASSRSGLSTIELLAVMAVIAILAAMGTPSLMKAMRQGALNQAAETIRNAHQIARSQARATHSGADHYGVVIAATPTGGAEVAVTFGPTASLATVARVDPTDPSSAPLFQRRLATSVVIDDGGIPLDGTRSWFCQHRTGYPVAAITPGSPPASVIGLRVRTTNGRMAVALSVYEIGIIAIDSGAGQ